MIQTQEPRLLMLVESNCQAGVPGSAGSGGAGGSGGHGGSGGLGGSGGIGGSGGSYRDSNGHTHYYSSGLSGTHGSSGFSGSSGASGANGARGNDGHPAPHGGILWVVSSEQEGILCQGGQRYDAEVTNFSVISAIDDGIFEPNERIMVSGVAMVNSGGLPLPSGAEAFIPNTQTIKFEPTRYTLPELAIGDSFVIPITYYGRIFDQPPPNSPGPFISKAEFHPRIELLGRPFEKSFLKQVLVVQYPVKLAFIRCPENLGRGEVATIEIGVQNISSMPYGDCPGSGGKVVLQVHFDQRLLPVGSSNIGLSDTPYTVTYDPSIRDSMYIQMQNIPPNEIVTVQLTIQMESRAELFDRCICQVDMFLRDKLIEYNLQKIRVSPFYAPSDPVADILMVTGSQISRKEFVYWQKILETLRVSVDFWDVERYNGLSVDNVTNSRHAVTWEGRYTGRMILYPHANLQNLWGIDIVRHFHGPSFRDGPKHDLDSSMILFLPPSAPHGPALQQFQDQGDLLMLRHLCLVDSPLQLPENAYAGKHLFQPGACWVSPTPYLSCEKKILRKLEKEDPSESHVVIARQVNMQSTGLFSYKYGSVDIRKVPLLRSCKFLCIDGAGGSKLAMGLDDRFLSPTSLEIPLASNFGQAYVATVYGLSVPRKLTFFQPVDEEPTATASLSLVFTLPNGISLSKTELIAVCLAQEVSDEVLNCTGSAKRVQYISEQVCGDATRFTAHGEVLIRAMELARKELKLRKKRFSHASLSRACQLVKQECKRVTSALAKAGVNSNQLFPLPPFSQLVDSSRFHFSHQHGVKEQRYNLAV